MPSFVCVGLLSRGGGPAHHLLSSPLRVIQSIPGIFRAILGVIILFRNITVLCN